ncbi:MAG: hypothetical protein ACOYKC_09450 [Anaerolineaceae bacterium]|jgi:hypothetical protein
MNNTFCNLIKINLTLMILLCFSLTACSNTLPDKDRDFYELAKLSEKDDVNESIKISLIQGDNTVFKKNYLVDVIVEIPNDKTPLYIDGEYIYFFYFDENNQTWRELKNLVTSTISDRTIETNEFGDSVMLVPAGVPDLEEIQLPAEVRVLFKTQVLEYNGNVGKQMAAYIDVIVEP